MSKLVSRITSNSTPVTETGCWLWDLSTHNGYGKIKVGGAMRYAHRVAYAEFIGEIPDGMCVCHKCDVPSCVNPDHLFLGTHTDNMRDKESKGRGYGRHLLSDESVSNIRDLHKNKLMSRADLADTYGVSIHTIDGVIYNRNWRNNYE